MCVCARVALVHSRKILRTYGTLVPSSETLYMMDEDGHVILNTITNQRPDVREEYPLN